MGGRLLAQLPVMRYEANGQVFMHLGLADLYIRRVEEIAF